MPTSAMRAQPMAAVLWASRHSPPDTREQREVPADHPELHALSIVRQFFILALPHGAERGRGDPLSAARYWATVASCHVGDDERDLESRK